MNSRVADEDIDKALVRYQRWEDSSSGESPAVIRAAMQRVMQEDFGVFRTGKVMEEGLKRLDDLRAQLKNAHLKDKSQVFNTERLAVLELDNLMATAYVTARSAHTRTESRGAHSREDFTKRDDDNWIKHTLCKLSDTQKEQDITFRAVNIKPHHIEPFEPKERVY